MTWQYKGVTLGLYAGGSPVVNPVAQFEGRITISATQLRIGGAQLRDAGNYTVEVTPTATTGLSPNSRSIQLRVFDAVRGVSLFAPSIAVEGRNVSLRCTWTAGTEITVQWGKGGAAVTADSRITISDGSLVINPARRGDAGEYSCTVSNPVSAQTATQSLTIYYGPDTPVLTKEAPKQCVGGGDVLVGQTVRLTCMSDSLPPALFSWQRDGQTVASGQPDSGVLSLQTFSTNESGRYVCTARNSITGGTSEQGTDLAVVVEQRREDAAVFVQKTNPNPGPPIHDLMVQEIWAKVPIPPSITCTPANPNAYTQPRVKTVATHGHRRRCTTRTTPTHTGTMVASTRIDSYTILFIIPIHSRTMASTIQLSDTPRFRMQTRSQTHSSKIRTLSYRPGLPRAAPSRRRCTSALTRCHELPSKTAMHKCRRFISILTRTQPMASRLSKTARFLLQPMTLHKTSRTRYTRILECRAGSTYRSDPRMHSHIDAGLIPTRYTQSNNASQRNANTQTYEREQGSRGRSDRSSGRRDTAASSSLQQMPWDQLRGTPAYPTGMLQRRQTSEYTSDSTDYTTHPPIREERMPSRSQSRPQSQTTLRGRAPLRQDVASVVSQIRSRSLDLRDQNTGRITQLEAAHRTQRSPRTYRESAQRNIRGSPSSQTALRQEATHSSNPQAKPLMSQQASVGRSAVSQGVMTQQGLTAPQGADTRALADPNHLPQAHMAQQHRAAPNQKPPRGLGTQTQPVIHDASHQPRQGGAAPPTPRGLKHLRVGRQQTQAALFHAGLQAGAHHPPTPPPVIPITQFQTIPKKRTAHKSPARGPQPPKPPVNMPVAQRPVQGKHHHSVQPHAATMPANHHHHHHPGNGHSACQSTQARPRSCSYPWPWQQATCPLHPPTAVLIMHGAWVHRSAAVDSPQMNLFLHLVVDVRERVFASQLHQSPNPPAPTSGAAGMLQRTIWTVLNRNDAAVSQLPDVLFLQSVHFQHLSVTYYQMMVLVSQLVYIPASSLNAVCGPSVFFPLLLLDLWATVVRSYRSCITRPLQKARRFHNDYEMQEKQNRQTNADPVADV
ncbi:HEPACAM family member 2 [Collichthys lucidus]|uniref:HEPACAM family member 2 n=1 Tax=Collichthys lucidus TaxID=240159 RepID=A0A4U5V3L8_COLLU|nr:HEPACAM family member 2 [Collichthys lucidus]